MRGGSRRTDNKSPLTTAATAAASSHAGRQAADQEQKGDDDDESGGRPQPPGRQDGTTGRSLHVSRRVSSPPPESVSSQRQRKTGGRAEFSGERRRPDERCLGGREMLKMRESCAVTGVSSIKRHASHDCTRDHRRQWHARNAGSAVLSSLEGRMLFCRCRWREEERRKRESQSSVTRMTGGYELRQHHWM